MNFWILINLIPNSFISHQLLTSGNKNNNWKQLNFIKKHWIKAQKLFSFTIWKQINLPQTCKISLLTLTRCLQAKYLLIVVICSETWGNFFKILIFRHFCKIQEKLLFFSVEKWEWLQQYYYGNISNKIWFIVS